jgi:hypothetical protein
LIEDRDILQANATIIGGLLIFFIFSLSVSLEQKIYGLNFMFGVSAIVLFPFGNSIRLCLDERIKPARFWFMGCSWNSNLFSIHVHCISVKVTIRKEAHGINNYDLGGFKKSRHSTELIIMIVASTA